MFYFNRQIDRLKKISKFKGAGLIVNQKKVQHIHYFPYVSLFFSVFSVFRVLSNAFFSRLTIGPTALYLEVIHMNIYSPSLINTININ